MRPLALLLTLALLLAGCVGGKDDAEEPLDAQESDDAGAADGDATPSTPPTPSPSARPSARPGAPTPPSAPTAPTPPAGPESNASAPSMVVLEGDTGAFVMLSAPDPAGTSGAEVSFAVLDLPRASPASGLLVAEWESQTPLDASMDVRLIDTDGNLIASASGASPLSVEIPGAAFASAVELRGQAFPTAPGVGIEYSVHLTLTVLYG